MTTRGGHRPRPVLAELVERGKLKVVGAMYDVSTGKVTFLDS
jgi:carbonic anhydrase